MKWQPALPKAERSLKVPILSICHCHLVQIFYTDFYGWADTDNYLFNPIAQRLLTSHLIAEVIGYLEGGKMSQGK